MRWVLLLCNYIRVGVASQDIDVHDGETLVGRPFDISGNRVSLHVKCQLASVFPFINLYDVP